MPKKKIIIIGAGIAGLSAGCYLQMNGYDTEIFEMHNIPGGLCTSWKRKDYIFDGCLHWLIGGSPEINWYDLWKELIPVEKLNIHHPDLYIRIVDKDGTQFDMHANLDKLAAEMKRIAPEDTTLIDIFIKGVNQGKKFTYLPEKPHELFTIKDYIKIMTTSFPIWGLFRRFKGLTVFEFFRKFQNPFFQHLYDKDELTAKTSMVAYILSVSLRSLRAAGYPIGGSLKYARLLEEKYVALGGTIHYKSKIKKIITSHNKACGVLLENNARFEADDVISAADGFSTIFYMLDGKYMNNKIKDYYENFELYPSLIQISLGIHRDFSEYPFETKLSFKKPIHIENGREISSIIINNYSVDQELSPPGKTALTVWIESRNYQYWQDLRENDRTRYKKEKEQLAHEVIQRFDDYYGHVTSHIEVIDVATPATYIRYTNNWKGSYQGWLVTPKTLMKNLENRLPGLDNFYMIGQWISPGGGVSMGLVYGRGIAQILCKRDKRPFTVAH